MTKHNHLPAIHPKYRADIDGLRAIAILSVVLYHAFPTCLKGGFVGVDVFFVISGFIISTTIINNLEKGTFSFREFYARRAKRIFPALILIMATCYVIGWFVLLPDRLNQLSRHIAAGAGFVSNFALWNESGYFDNMSETKPLLHLWSLGIEEQFYFVWPLLLFFGWRIRSRFKYYLMLIIGVSFVYNLVLVKSDIMAAYYSPISRIWEIMAGSLLAYMAYNKPNLFVSTDIKSASLQAVDVSPDNRISTSDCKAILGLSLILLSCLIIDKDKQFPGYLALLPIVGTSLVLSAGPSAWLNRTVLSCRLMVLIGLISYPLYLWHWVLLSFVRIHSGRVAAPEIRFAAVLVSFALAWLTYRFVEKPFRNAFYDTAKVVALCSILLLIGCCGYYKYKQGNFSGRYSNKLSQKNKLQLTWNSVPDSDCLRLVDLEGESKRKQIVFCTLKDNIDIVKVAVIGDSTANDLYPGFEKVYKKNGVGVINIGNGTCAPFRGVDGTRDYNKECRNVNNKIYDFLIKNKGIETVVLSFIASDIRIMQIDGISSNASIDERFNAVSKLVNKDITDLVSSGKSVYAAFDSPTIGIDPRQLVVKGSAGVGSIIREKDFVFREPYLSKWLDMLSKRTDVKIFYKFPDIKKDHFFDVLDENGTLLYRDDHHLTYAGSDLVARRFMNLSSQRR